MPPPFFRRTLPPQALLPVVWVMAQHALRPVGRELAADSVFDFQ